MIIKPFSTWSPELAADFIEEFEGRKLEAYKCSAGVFTIGVGHIKDVKKGDVITNEEATRLFHLDLHSHARGLAPAIKVPVTKNQFIALLSLAFNIGVANARNSDTVAFLNKHEYQNSADAFMNWRKAGGKVSNGLIRRRSAERELFLKED